MSLGVRAPRLLAAIRLYPHHEDCNHYLGKLDSTLILHNHISLVLQMFGIPGKGDSVRRQIGYATRSAQNRGFKVRQDDLSKITISPQRVLINAKDPPGFDDLKFRRALHHIAFNYLALIVSPAAVLDSKYDAVRKYIRSPSRDEKWPYLQVIGSHSKHFASIQRRLCALAEIVTIQIIVDDFYADLLNTGTLFDWGEKNIPGNLLKHI